MGKFFSIKKRRSNFSTIARTLDTVYRLEWVSSAAKNECVAAVGLKWMLNQAVMDYHRQIANYFNLKGVSVIFVLRRNLLRRLVSVLANAYDRDAKQINGTHKSHVHTREEADLLARFKPTLNVSALVPDLIKAERMMTDSLEYFRTTRHMIFYYEDLIKNPKLLSEAQEFLRVPVRKLESHQVKIHIKPLSEQINNWEEVHRELKGSLYEHFLDNQDEIS
uniref:Sulfotransferase n=1 Tax=Davidia involucrata TaxID=16924 RepID=A0A5B6YXM8_DAVIN